MFAAILADIVFTIHFLFILFVGTGAFLLLRYPRLIWLHLPALTWAVLISIFGWICPLTPLENYFRALAELEVYRGGFIAHYLEPIVYPAGLTREMQGYLALSLICYNGLIYFSMYRRARQNKSS